MSHTIGKEHLQALHRQALALCGSSADAHDLVQDTLERATRQGIAAEIRDLRAWLLKMMRNLFIDRCRAMARRPLHDSIDDSVIHHTTACEPEPEPPWARLTIRDIRIALDEIDLAYREVYIMHTFDKLSYSEIGLRLDLAPLTVGTRLNRARLKLRKVLGTRFGLELE